MEVERIQQGLKVNRTGGEQQRRRRQEQPGFTEALEATLDDGLPEGEPPANGQSETPLAIDTVSITAGSAALPLANDLVSISATARVTAEVDKAQASTRQPYPLTERALRASLLLLGLQAEESEEDPAPPLSVQPAPADHRA